MKHTTITIDEDSWKQAKQLGLNLSYEIREYIQKLVNSHNKDIEGINISIVRNKLEVKQRELKQLQFEIKMYEGQIERYEKARKEKEEERLQKEKEVLESSKKCSGCGCTIEGQKSHKFPVGSICNGCFMNSDKEQMTKWNQKNI